GLLPTAPPRPPCRPAPRLPPGAPLPGLKVPCLGALPVLSPASVEGLVPSTGLLRFSIRLRGLFFLSFPLSSDDATGLDFFFGLSLGRSILPRTVRPFSASALAEITFSEGSSDPSATALSSAALSEISCAAEG